MIKHFGVYETGIVATKVAPHCSFPDTLFDKTLVKLIVKKAKEVVDASENNNIKKSNACVVLTCDYSKEGKAILNEVSFEEDLCNELKKAYGDSIQVDSIHKGSRYGLVAMFSCGIYCFLKTLDFGSTIMESESSKDADRGLKTLGLQDAKY
eukprot:snap_masked-scaffold_4-processed-gene-21.72-mRNA-1 protein AED:1.00 eAED:1.00 QI:0/0/0/0/1/1/2/0/151